MSVYTDFVKAHIGEFKHLPPKQRMAAVAKMYKRQNGSGAEMKGGAVKRTKTKRIAMVAPRNEVFGRGHMMADTPANQLLGYGKIPANEIGGGISSNFFRTKDLKTLNQIGDFAKNVVLPVAGALL